MNARKAAFVIKECSRLERENVNSEGWYIPPSQEQQQDLARRAEAFDYFWMRLWHKFFPER